MPKRAAKDHQHKNFNLPCTEEQLANGTWDANDIVIVLLHGIRAELTKLNALLHCFNFQQIPHTLKRIDKRLSTTRKLTKGRVAK